MDPVQLFGMNNLLDFPIRFSYLWFNCYKSNMQQNDDNDDDEKKSK